MSMMAMMLAYNTTLQNTYITLYKSLRSDINEALPRNEWSVQ